jgi:hypothetical protein
MTARPRRALGTILVLSGMLPWVIATLSLIPVEASLGAISGGALVVGGDHADRDFRLIDPETAVPPLGAIFIRGGSYAYAIFRSALWDSF